MSDFNLVLPGDEAAQKAAEEAEAQLKAAQTAMPETAPTLDFSQKPAPAMPTLTLPSEEAQMAARARRRNSDSSGEVLARRSSR